MISAVSNSTTPPPSTKGSSGATTSSEMQDRFLKLLVAQINNQDPLNPMDNAQMTSQMAQINTVSGIQQVNDTLNGLAGQFGAMQTLQAANLIGHDVLVPGNGLTRDPSSGLVGSAFDLGGSASAVRVEIMSPTGEVLGTVSSGAMPPGRNSFSWDASAYSNYPNLNYRVTAVNGQQAVAATPYSTEKVQAVGLVDGQLTLDLGSGKRVPYTGIAAVL